MLRNSFECRLDLTIGVALRDEFDPKLRSR
jgi:hypothetical protein